MNNMQPLNNVFVGSTITDLHEYRIRVKDALELANLTVQLSEDWIGGYDDTVARCHQRLDQADGYLGIFAYLYGSVPPEYEESITHLEFRWSFDKWGKSNQPRIAIFMPGTAFPLPEGQVCEAEQMLRKEADKHLKGLTKAKRRTHDKCLEHFHDEVMKHDGKPWRTVNWFRDLADLLVRATNTCHIWRNDLFAVADAARKQTAAPAPIRQPTPQEWGRLGRRKQLYALKDILVQIRDATPSIPGAAILIAGSEDAGHSYFLDAALELVRFQDERPPERLQPPMRDYGLSELVQSVANLVVELRPGEPPLKTPRQLADRLHAILQKQSITLVINQIGQMNGGVLCFQRDFWDPLFSRLAMLNSGDNTHHLLLLVTDYTEIGNASKPAITHWQEGEDITNWNRLAALPNLGAFTKAELRSWMLNISNREKRLPEAFLRRCLYVRLHFPEKVETLIDIVRKNTHLTEEEIDREIMATAVKHFKALRATARLADAEKLPSTSELIDWVQIIHKKEETVASINATPDFPPYWQTLFKTYHDLDAYPAAVKRSPGAGR